jgi:hypothetical protein
MDKIIYITPMTQADLDLDPKVGDKVEVMWEELHGKSEPDVFEAYEARLI